MQSTSCNSKVKIICGPDYEKEDLVWVRSDSMEDRRSGCHEAIDRWNVSSYYPRIGNAFFKWSGEEHIWR